MLKHLKWFIALVAMLAVPLTIAAAPASASFNCSAYQASNVLYAGVYNSLYTAEVDCSSTPGTPAVSKIELQNGYASPGTGVHEWNTTYPPRNGHWLADSDDYFIMGVVAGTRGQAVWGQYNVWNSMSCGDQGPWTGAGYFTYRVLNPATNTYGPWHYVEGGTTHALSTLNPC